MSLKARIGVGVAIVVSWVSLLVCRSTFGELAALADLVPPREPWSHAWRHAQLAFVAAPLVTVGVQVAFLAPGVLLALAFGKARSFLHAVVLGFLASIGLSLALTLLQHALGLGADSIVPLWLAATLAGGLAASRAPLRLVASDRRRAALLLLAGIVGSALLAPLIHWEAMNLDGTEAFEFGRSLDRGWLPSFELSRGAFGFSPTFWLFAYPNSWFIRALGPVEAAVRVPLCLWLAGLFAALVALIEIESPRELALSEELLLLLGIAGFGAAVGLNATYDPFFADLAEPGATDALGVFLCVGALWALWSGRRLAFLAFGACAFSAVPGGLVFLVALSAVFWVSTGVPGHARRDAALLLLSCVAFALLHRWWYLQPTAPGANDQFSAWNLLRRLYPPTLFEFARLGALLFPTGILPALSLLWARPRSPLTWTTSCVTALCFGVLYSQAWTALHQFTLAMVLPLAVFWRLVLERPEWAQRILRVAVLASTLVCLWLAVPRQLTLHPAVRRLGAATDMRVGDAADRYPEALDAAQAISLLLPDGYRIQYPEQPWGADAESWLLYSLRPKTAGVEINYVVQRVGDAAPPNFRSVGSRDGIEVWVRDEARWRRDVTPGYERAFQSPLYEPIFRATAQFFARHAHSKE